MIAFPRCTTARRLRGRRIFLFLGIADDGSDDLEDWMCGTGEMPAALAHARPRCRKLR
jgi:hypothetical protein